MSLLEFYTKHRKLLILTVILAVIGLLNVIIAIVKMITIIDFCSKQQTVDLTYIINHCVFYYIL